MKRGIGYALVFFGSLSAIGQVIAPALNGGGIHAFSVVFALTFVVVGIVMARDKKEMPGEPPR